ncbi:hypothetical protein EBF04_29975 [Streptomyces sp. I6]|nr:hypothetical protein EBF04_29975 [Streptomyces sp. I6]
MLQADGKIVAAGFSTAGGTSDFALARYDTNGTLDAAFGTGGLVTTDFGPGSFDQASGVAVQADGKIVAAGLSDTGGLGDFALARYNTNGTLDAAFGTGGLVTTDFGGSTDQAFGVVLQADGKIVAAGSSTTGGTDDFALARYDTNGTLDATFGTGGLVTTDFGPGSFDQAFGVAVQADGKIVAAGLSDTGGTDDFALARYENGAAVPSLTIGKQRMGSFVEGRTGSYAIGVGNQGPGATDGSTVTVRDILPHGLTAVAIGARGGTAHWPRSPAPAATSCRPRAATRRSPSRSLCRASTRPRPRSSTPPPSPEAATAPPTPPPTPPPSKPARNARSRTSPKSPQAGKTAPPLHIDMTVMHRPS